MGISIWQLLIILLIIVLLFGSKKIRSLGGDLGSAMRGFKKEMNSDEDKSKAQDEPPAQVNLKEDAEFKKETDSKQKEPGKRD